MFIYELKSYVHPFYDYRADFTYLNWWTTPLVVSHCFLLDYSNVLLLTGFMVCIVFEAVLELYKKKHHKSSFH